MPKPRNNALKAPLPSYMKGFGSPSSGNTKEVEFRTTEYFEFDRSADPPAGTAEKPVLSKIMSFRQYMAGYPYQPNASGSNLSRPKTGKLYAMPKFSNGEQTSQLYTVLAAVRGSNSSNVATMNPTNTTVMPEASPKWVKAAEFNYDQDFDQNWLRPVLDAVSGEQGFEAFALTVIDPDTGALFKAPVQFKFEYTFLQTLPVKNLVREVTDYVENWEEYSEPSSFNEHYATVQPLRLTNVS